MKKYIFGKEMTDISIERLIDYIFVGQYNKPQMIVTPNAYHFYLASKDRKLDDIYFNSDLVVCDSRVLQLIKKIKGIDIDLVPGSDLVLKIFSDDRLVKKHILIVGGDEDYINELQELYTDCSFYSVIPKMGFINDEELVNNLVISLSKSIIENEIHFVFFALGSPQQEVLARLVKDNMSEENRCMFFCIGASFDFLLDRKPRAPVLMQKLGIEWLFRMASEPKRLSSRYIKCAFFLLRNIKNV